MSNDSFRFKVITFRGLYIDKVVQSLSCEIVNLGLTTILPHHANFMGRVEISAFSILENNHIRWYAVGGGHLFFDHEKNEAILTTDCFENEDDIDLQRAQQAKEKADNDYRNAKTERDAMIAEIKLKKALNRITVKNK